jgi:isopentenyl-diphosphate delta-isomerase
MPDILSDRKDSHLRIAATTDVQYRETGGFEDVMLLHQALPEIDLKQVDCSTSFLGKKLKAPILITGMTGGTDAGGAVNKKLAKGAEEAGVALGLGSQRPMLRNKDTASHYQVRKLAPSIPIIGNIGAAQLKEYGVDKIEWMISTIEADALAIHLNPLQEAVQPEGETTFSGVLAAIGKLCDKLDVPVIAKETGAGINGNVAAKLFEVGVKFVEVSGRGGTSWSKVEYARGGRLPGFEEWGFPTVPAIVEASMMDPAQNKMGGANGSPLDTYNSSRVIATGGVRNGLDVAKGIALGAKLGGAALPFFKADDVGVEAKKWTEQIRTAMFLCGAKNLSQLSQAPVLITGKSADWLRLRGFEPAAFAARAINPTRNGKKKMGGRDEGEPTHYL